MPESPQPSFTPKDKDTESSSPGKRQERSRTATGLSHRFIDSLSWIITAAWAISFVLDATVKTYDPPVSVHALMMVVAGAAFGSTLINRGDTREPLGKD